VPLRNLRPAPVPLRSASVVRIRLAAPGSELNDAVDHPGRAIDRRCRTVGQVRVSP
jgi:hypothetical protein